MEDTPNPHVRLMWKHIEFGGYRMLVLTGRKHHHRGVTKRWLEANQFYPDGLWTRDDGDNRPDHVVKAEIFDKHIRENYNVLGVFDDRLQVARMWHLKGVPLFRVGDPEAVF